MFIGAFNMCEPEEERFNVGTQTFTEGDGRKTVLFRTFFTCALEIAQPNFTKKETTVDGASRTLCKIDRLFN